MNRHIILWAILALFPILLGATEHCNKEDFVIAIDIGHTKKRPGTLSSKGFREFCFNQNLAKLLLEDLTYRGFTQAFLINEDGADISLTDRTDIANEKRADLFISIHHDSVQPHYLSSWNYQSERHLYSDLFHGYSLFYSEKNENPESSLVFARLLGTELQNDGFTPTLHHAEKIKGENRELVDKERGIYRFDDLVVLKTAKMPAILLECGIIVNRNEETLLSKPEYQKKLVLSMTRAIEKACIEMGSGMNK